MAFRGLFTIRSREEFHGDEMENFVKELVVRLWGPWSKLLPLALEVNGCHILHSYLICKTSCWPRRKGGAGISMFNFRDTRAIGFQAGKTHGFQS